MSLKPIPLTADPQDPDSPKGAIPVDIYGVSGGGGVPGSYDPADGSLEVGEGFTLSEGGQTESFPGPSASGLGTIALGAAATASNAGSVALGVGSQATGYASVALGVESQATEPHTVAVGGRRITDLSDGTDPSDAVTLSQLEGATAGGGGGVKTHSLYPLDPEPVYYPTPPVVSRSGNIVTLTMRSLTYAENDFTNDRLTPFTIPEGFRPTFALRDDRGGFSVEILSTGDVVLTGAEYISSKGASASIVYITLDDMPI